MAVDTDTPALSIGILGGTFDPIHLGHLAIAEAVLDELVLDRVILIPAGRPWLKSDKTVTAACHRLAMVRLAIRDRLGLEVSTIEVDRPGPTYTVDTLAELRQDLGDAAELYFILGMDSVRELRRWYEPERLFEMCTVVAVSRPDSLDVSPPKSSASSQQHGTGSGSVRGPMLDISATDIRQRIAEGVPSATASHRLSSVYIHEHGLYLGAEDRRQGRQAE